MKIKGLKAMIYNRLHRDDIYSKADFWDSKAEDLDGKAVSMWPNNHLNEHYHAEQLQTLGEFLPSMEGKSVLDVGCGIGRLSRYFAENGASVVGVDFSEKAIEIARRQSQGNNPAYRVESIFDMADEARYDMVVCWGVVTVACRNGEELTDAVRRFRRSLRPGGSLVFLEPIHRGFLHRVLNLSLNDFVSILEKDGFDVEKIVNLHFWPMRLALAYVPWPKLLTSPGYHLGQWLMRTVFRGFPVGDYKGILASPKQ